ncbi:MAG: prepilin-type N-terminal cleavage/methylation domain-containing protein [Puniceicoccales bacterium]|nr:prepilin-type N-terminal cleavage/methylation domain-containing protein [Puniceicoccales bacterium]
MRSRPFSRSRGFTLVEVIVTTVLAGAILAFAVNFVRSGIQLHRETTIRKNLQTVWIAANQHFLETNVNEVNLTELEKNGALQQIKRAADEDYTRVNNGKIIRDAAKLELVYKSGATDVTVTYQTR